MAGPRGLLLLLREVGDLVDFLAVLPLGDRDLTFG